MTASKNDLLNQEPADLLKWLESVQSGSSIVSESSNWWLGIAQNAVSSAYKAGEEAKPEKKLLWTQVAIQLYDYLANVVNPEGRNSYECSSKMFSVSMIRELGAVTGQPALDPNLIEEWFFRRLTMPLEETKEKASNWPTRPIEEIGQLRDLKSRLNVMEQLRLAGYLQNNAELSKWLQIRDKLP